MSIFSNIDFDALPPPTIIEELSYEAQLARLLAKVPGLLVSDPGYRLLEVFSYELTLVRARMNASARAGFRRYATGSDLENLGASVEVAKQVIVPGDPDAVPPVPPTYEDDEMFRRRQWMARNALSSGGAIASYRAHAIADASLVGRVKDVSISSPTPGLIRVAVLGTEGTGEASPELLAGVAAVLDPEHVRPHLDDITVDAAQVILFNITAALIVYPNQDNAVILTAANASLASYLAKRNVPGATKSRAGITQALMVAGVMDVDLTLPVANIVVDPDQSSYCDNVVVTIGGVGV